MKSRIATTRHATAAACLHEDRSPGSPETPLRVVKPTRRRFLVNCSALAVTASLAPAALGRALRAREVPLEQIGPGNFARQLDSAFVVPLDRGSYVVLRLVEVRPLATPANSAPDAEDAGNEKFALLFRGPLAAPLRQNTYWFEHSRIGTFAMFIVPIGCRDQNHCYYEAIFNRPAPSDRVGAFKPGYR